jgi:hypothetical protein
VSDVTRHTASGALDDKALFDTLSRLKAVSPDDAMAIAAHIGARAAQARRMREAFQEIAAECPWHRWATLAREMLSDSQETSGKQA